MKNLFFTFLLVAIATYSCFGQLQNRYWYFGENLGIDFGTSLNTPIQVPGIGNTTTEGVATVSDQAGNFLFYTDGKECIRVPNIKLTTPLPGHPSSTQSSIIVPAPNSCDLFYVFTVDFMSGSNGLKYTTIDKNGWAVGPIVSINSKCIEKVTAIPHSNGSDYWIVSVIPAPSSTNRQFVICNLTSTGVSTPVVQTISGCPSAPTANLYGHIKSSCNGNFLAVAFGNGTTVGVDGVQDNRVELFKFNSTNGEVSSYIQSYQIRAAYGVEFSPNEKYVFCSGLGGAGIDGIVNRYDITTNSITPTNSVNISDANGYDTGALQLGPNGVVYLAKDGNQSIDAFTTPNLAGWTYTTNAISFSGNGKVRLGLPNMICQFNTCVKNPNISFDPCCPPMNSDLMKTLFKIVPTGTITDPYKIIFTPTAQFKASSQAYCDYIKTLYPSINRLTFEWNLYNAGTGNAPGGGSRLEQYYNWFEPQGNGNIQSQTNFFNQLPNQQPLEINKWYKITVGIFTEPDTKAFDGFQCSARTNFSFRIQVQNGMRKAQVSDGKNIVAEMTIDPNSKKN